MAKTTANTCHTEPEVSTTDTPFTNQTIPTVPIATPNTCNRTSGCLNNNVPMINVKIGVQLFNIPAYPEEIPVSAYVKRKAGTKLPKKATTAKLKINFTELKLLKCLNPNGNKADEAKSIRIAPTWLLLKMESPETLSIIPIFIRMKELPHIVARKRSMPQFFNSRLIRQM